jgi:hypothetical protein
VRELRQEEMKRKTTPEKLVSITINDFTKFFKQKGTTYKDIEIIFALLKTGIKLI